MAKFKISDPFFAQQWHFAQLGDIKTIWSEYSGKGIHIGLFDEPMDAKHADLVGNYDPSLHFVYNGQVMPGTIEAVPGEWAHGTCCAGLAAAGMNGVGGVGVAWGASITGVNVFADDTADRWKATLEHAAAFDVMTNSWGPYPYYDDSRNRNMGNAGTLAELAAYEYVADNGRGGLGTVILQAAGNVKALANFDLLNSLRFEINVAATYKGGTITGYSNFGSSILVAAPAASVTTDVSGTGGYNPANGSAGDMTSDFRGTSAAAPVTAGVVALMLDAEANLGWRDVQQILATSARMAGSAIGLDAKYEVSDPHFQQMLVNNADIAGLGGDTWNDGGRYYSGDYGFGTVDAFAAVRLSEVWRLIHATPQTSANEQTVRVSGSPGLALNAVAGSTTTYSLTVAAGMEVENIDLTLSVHFSVDDPVNETWLIRLISPTGSIYDITYDDALLLTDDPSYDPAIGEGFSYHANDANGLTWTFGVAQVLGESSDGTWKIEFLNQTQGGNDHATLDAVTIDFYGKAEDNNDVHYITADFLNAMRLEKQDAAANPETVRNGIITDTNGGDDWLVMATLKNNLSVDLNAGGKLLNKGKLWAKIGATSEIENVVTGDGHDRIKGNALDNTIYGMRGRDSISGGAGDDTICGGAGKDQLNGGDGADCFVFERGDGRDTVTDFRNDVDTLCLDRDLLRDASMTAQQVISTYGKQISSGFVLQFDSATSILFKGITNGALLVDDLIFA